MADVQRLSRSAHDRLKAEYDDLVNKQIPANSRDIALARSYGVHSHTHLAETQDEHAYCLQAFGRTPVELAEDLGWIGPDVWHAHMVHPSDAEVTRLGRTQTGVAHCPSSNMRLASGVAPLRALQRAVHYRRPETTGF